ncbi:hypothetical protein EDD11_001641 [Mortierella claussenii]|nr:hypothetical protein EDD11_001641 [Mortierella claussenii]
MMQASFNPEVQVQTHVNLKPMSYKNILAMGFPFVPVQRVDVNQEGVDLRCEVDDICVDKGTPLVLENWHKHPIWNSELFTFPVIDEKYGNSELLCRDLRKARDVKMSMRDYIREVHADSLATSSHAREIPKANSSREFPLTPPSTSPVAASEDGGGESTDEEVLENMRRSRSLSPLWRNKVKGISSPETLTSKDSKPLERLHTTTSAAFAPIPCDTIPAYTVQKLESDSSLPTATAGLCQITPQHRTGKKSCSVAKASQRKKSLLYAKDVTCPEDWRIFLMEEALPQFLGYLRENDLNRLNTEVAAENLMIYIGQAGTWTPAHIDQCGAIGHNIMAWADQDSSSIWFMVRAKDKEKAEALWRSFGQPLEYEGYFASVDQLRQAKFPIYVVEQKIGDFIMVPSLSYHQVVNLGKATIKVSWNRLTAHCLKAAVNIVLPRIARPEGYRIRTIIKSALVAWTKLLCSQDNHLPLPKEQFCESYKDILTLFQTIVEEEWVDFDLLKSKNKHLKLFTKPKRLGNTLPAVCDFCSTDLWNRQFHCMICAADGDNYDLCTRCYSLGRGCAHRAMSMEFVEQFSMKSCRHLYTKAIRAWNNSRVLTECKGYETLKDGWALHGLALLFTRPQDDERNRGGVGDRMDRSFAGDEEDENDNNNQNRNSADKSKSNNKGVYDSHEEKFKSQEVAVRRVRKRQKSRKSDCFADAAFQDVEEEEEEEEEQEKPPKKKRGRPRLYPLVEIIEEPKPVLISGERRKETRGRPRKIPMTTPTAEGDPHPVAPSETSESRLDVKRGRLGSVSRNENALMLPLKSAVSLVSSHSPSFSTTSRSSSALLSFAAMFPDNDETFLGNNSRHNSNSNNNNNNNNNNNICDAQQKVGTISGDNRRLLMDQEGFEKMMGLHNEMAVRYVYSNHTWRSWMNVKSQEWTPDEFYQEIFRMDAYWHEKDPDVLNHLRRDLLEYDQSRKRLATSSSTEALQDSGHHQTNNARAL